MYKSKKKDWFKIKRYPHIGFPLKYSDRIKWIESYILDKSKIASHSFLPFIHKTSKVRKFRKEYNSNDGQLIKSYNAEGEKTYRKSPLEPKKRELYYAGHLDSLIFSYYSHILLDKYEEKIKEYRLDDVVTAYRSIPISKDKPLGPNKCNIDFANDTFNYIRKYNKEEFSAITFDISGFFDNLDHNILLEKWVNILNQGSKLPDDHFNIFKNITRFSYVNIVDVFKVFQNRIYVQEIDRNGNLLSKKRKRVSRIKFLRKENAIAFCTKKEFIKIKSRLIQNTKLESSSKILRKKGIPQGSPISSTLANLYLIDFDKKLNDELTSINGIYRRYSDDMVVVCPHEHHKRIIDLIKTSINEVKLVIQDTKTQIFHFKRQNERLICGQEFDNGINWNKNFQYLGFDFNGEFTLLKSASMSGYYRKMKRTINRAKRYANNPNNKNHKEIFKRRILNKFSYKGAQRRRIWEWSDKVNGFVKTERYDWGNFLSYAKKASSVMDKNNINSQIKNHWKLIHKELSK